MTNIAWQGWRLALPPRWNPVKLDGDYDNGFASFADLTRQKLGLRWTRDRRLKKDAKAWAENSMLHEVGVLAAEEARPHALGDEWTASLLYTEPKPPGRDVWVGVSKISGRGVQVIYHARHRNRVLMDLLPQLHDSPPDQKMPWAVFELSCEVPAGLKLHRPRLNAGDLQLLFGNDTQPLLVRQIALAELAIKKMPLEKRLTEQQKLNRKFYRPSRQSREMSIAIDGRELVGLAADSPRRRRFFALWRMAKSLTTAVLHDKSRDRLVIVQARDEPTVRQVAASVGRLVE